MKSTPFLTHKKDSGTASLVLFIAQSLSTENKR